MLLDPSCHVSGHVRMLLCSERTTNKGRRQQIAFDVFS